FRRSIRLSNTLGTSAFCCCDVDFKAISNAQRPSQRSEIRLRLLRPLAKAFGVVFCVQELVSDDFHEYPLSPPAVEFAVENLFPRPEIQFAFCNRYHDFATHDLTFEVSVSVVFAGPVVSIGGGRGVRR